MGSDCGTKHGTKFWVNLEPCGLICGMMTWFLLFFGMYATSTAVIIPWLGVSFLGVLNMLLFNGVSLLAIYCHYKAMTTDPGAVPRDAKPLTDDQEELDHDLDDQKVERFKKFCRKCRAFKPKRAHHCSICQRCVVKMDHHCPWVNNCVGIGNHKLFILFVFWVFIACFYSLALITGKYISCAYGTSGCGEVNHHLMIIFLVVEALLFGLFTLCMIGDQATTVLTNQTQIDRLKNIKHNAQAVEVNEVFGSHVSSRFQAIWLLPFSVHFPDAIRDIILGYRTETSEETAPLMSSSNGNLAGDSSNPKLKSRSGKRKNVMESASDESNYGIEEPVSNGVEWLAESATIPLDDSHHDDDQSAAVGSIEMSRTTFLKSQIDRLENQEHLQHLQHHPHQHQIDDDEGNRTQAEAKKDLNIRKRS